MTPAASTDSTPATTTRIFDPHRLRWIQRAWLVASLTALVVFVVSLPTGFEALRTSPRWAVGYQVVLDELGISNTLFAGYFIALEVFTILRIAGLMVVIYRKRADDWMALLMSFTLLMLATGISVSVVTFAPVFTFIFLILATSSLMLVLLLFPDGQFVPRRGRWLVLIEIPVFVFYSAILTKMLSGTPVDTQVFLLALILALPLEVALVAQVYRYRHRSTREQRQQTKWIILGFVIYFGAIILMTTSQMIFPALAFPTLFSHSTVYALPSFINMVVMATLLLAAQFWIASAVALSMVRHQLWGVDLVIHRSLVYGGVTVLLAVGFALEIILLQPLAEQLLGRDASITAIAIYAVVIAFLFNPIRRWTQQFVDKKIFGFRYDLHEVARADDHPTITHPGAYSGRTLGTYETLDLIGKGGMGEVYKGTANGLTVALKVLPTSLAEQEQFRQRFEHEARAMTALQHPHIIRMLGSGVSDGTYYLAMEYIDGPELGRVIRQHGKLPVDDAHAILTCIASALDYAHAKGYIHRDIKPSNIMLRSAGDSPWDAVLMDFGIAKIQESHTVLTGTGAIGTIDYMAPEQITAAREVDHRADIYSLGVMLYEMLTGERPFKGNPGQVLFAHLQQPPPDPRDAVADIPRAAAYAVMRALAKDADDRYASTGELAAAMIG